MSTPRYARDWDLVREVLIWAENGGDDDTRPAVDDAKLAYHCRLLHQAGLIEKATVADEPGGGPCYVAFIGPPTFKGHDALQAIRDDTAWAKIKGKLAEHGIPALFDVVVSIAKGYAQQSGLPLG
jgi:hypothetical protein